MTNEQVPMQSDCHCNRSKRSIEKKIALEAYAEYHIQHSSQSFERLHERGGFAQSELIGFLYMRIRRLVTGKEEQLW